MMIDNAIAVIRPQPDSQFRLVPCQCGSDNVAYVQHQTETAEPWCVQCFDCGNVVDKGAVVRHDAQLAWNQGVGV